MRRPHWSWALLAVPAAALGVLGACSDSGSGGECGAGIDGSPPEDGFYGCTASGSLTSGAAVMVGAAKVDVTPERFEIANPMYLRARDNCANGEPRCGQLIDTHLNDCGFDGLCPRDEGYVDPDADGSERDGEPDWFLDCGLDQLCPGDAGYTAPDEGEGNGVFDGFWMAGFENNHPVQGVHDPIWARAAVFEQGGVQIAIVGLDAVGVFNSDVRIVRQMVAQMAPELEIDYILISGTHNHEGPDTAGLWGPADPVSEVPTATGVNREWMENVYLTGTANAIIEAARNKKVATLSTNTIHTGSEGFLKDTRDPVVIHDELNVLVARDESDTVITTLINWGNHPECLSDINNLISSDFPDPLREGVENGLPAAGDAPAMDGVGGVAVYVQGTVGGLMTPLRVPVTSRAGEELGGSGNYTRCWAYGDNLAVKALEAIAGATPLDEVQLSFRATAFDLMMKNVFFHVAFFAGFFYREAHQFDETLQIGENGNFPTVLTEMAMLRFGPDLAMYSLPGEIFPEMIVGGYDGSWRCGKDTDGSCETTVVEDGNPNPPPLDQAPAGPYMDDMVSGEHVWTVGLGNDFLGYIVPAFQFELAGPDDRPGCSNGAAYWDEACGDHYEETNSIGPDTEPELQTRFRLLIDGME